MNTIRPNQYNFAYYEYYKEIRKTVGSQLRTLNSYTDELDNIHKDWFIQFFAHGPKSVGIEDVSFYIYFKFNCVKTMDTKVQATWFTNQIIKKK